MKLRLTIEIDPQVLRHLEDQAQKQGLNLEVIIARRLTACQDHVSTKPLYFSDLQRQDLEKLLGENLSTPEVALKTISKALSLAIDEHQITLKPDLLYRLQGRNLAKIPFGDFVGRTAVEELERYCEMR